MKHDRRSRVRPTALRRLTGNMVNRFSVLPDAGANASQSARRRFIALAIVGVLLFAVAFAAVRTMIHPKQTPRSNDTAETQVTSANLAHAAEPVVHAVNAFAAFTLEQAAARGNEFNDSYATEGLRLLAAVVDALMLRDSLVRDGDASTPSQMRAEADRLERAAGLTSPAMPTRAAFIAAAEIVTVVQRKNYPHLEQATARLRDAARSIRLNRPLREQSAEIESFFQRASDAVQGMTAVTS